MVPRTWKAVPTANTFASQDPKLRADMNPNYPGGAPWAGALGQSQVMDAWCSLTPSKDDGRLWAPLGGGHGDYAGNEGYVIDLMSEAPAWALLRRPSGALPDAPITYADGQESTGLYSDGRLRASHTYNNIIHTPGEERLFVAYLSAPFYNPIATPQNSYWIHGTTGEHSLASDYTALTQVSGSGGGGCCYDPVRHCVWHIRNSISSNMFLKTDLATGVTTKHGYANAWVGGGSRMIYVPGHDVIAHITNLSGGSGLQIWNPANSTIKGVAAVAGSPSAGLHGGAFPAAAAGGEWIPELGCIVLWDNNAPYSAELTTLTPPASDPMNGTWTWGVLAPSEANSVTPPPRVGGDTGVASVYGRFGYLPALKGCYLQVRASAQMHFFATE